MPFVQAPNSRNRQNSSPKRPGDAASRASTAPSDAPKSDQGASKSPFGGLPTKARQEQKPRRELRVKRLNAKGIEPETPFRTLGPPKTRDADQRHAKGRRQTHMGSSAAFLLRGRRESPSNEKGSPLGSPSPGASLAPPRPEPAQRAPGAGGALVSHRVAPAVPSALAGLTSGFGMGPGVPRPPWPPAPGGRCGAGCVRRVALARRPGGRTALEE